ncbi:hypothetical protein KG088_17250 [Halomonas sp. TRM85114]|uniref:hypothetical protein n=1 Tax=Halomonas jincaotanensis TaxID=2810616 RepID=UPI001BD4F64B|nr:hypothetical protein [Halomonas jincaotanensis]MBS9405360.1 hypothetical protein [Halomonas jincaotanensis]
MSHMSIVGNSLKIEDISDNVDCETPIYYGTGHFMVNGRHVGSFESFVFAKKVKHEGTSEVDYAYEFDSDNFSVKVKDEWIDYLDEEISDYELDLSQIVSEAMIDEIDIPEVSVAVNPRIYTEEGWVSGFVDVDILIDPGKMNSVWGFNELASSFECVPFEIGENGLEFSGDNDSQLNECLSDFFDKYTISDRGQEVVRKMVMDNVELKLKEIGITDYESAINFDSSEYRGSAFSI